MRIPFLRGTLVSEDGKAICLYLPLTSKDLSYRVYSSLRKKIAELGGPEQFYITGLPVAEDTFGVEMFIQMAISAPVAMLVIFLLMLAFFRKLVLILSPMIVALVSVVVTMSVLIIAGFPVHIMSSMIPIFIMPIAVLDSIHIISEFFERYQQTRDRRQTILAVMDELFVPMLYTSLTSATGFASLALTPIPPVQVFGLFVAGGIMVAWLLTVTFIPAYVMYIKPETLANFGAKHSAEGSPVISETPMSRFLRWVGRMTYRRAKPILAAALVVAAVAVYGISRININDNPVKWFASSHPIRVADRVLNEHFGGTYMAYLALRAEGRPFDPEAFADAFAQAARKRAGELAGQLPEAPQIFEQLIDEARRQARASESRKAFFDALTRTVERRAAAAGDAQALAWDAASLFVAEQAQGNETFKDPRVLRFQQQLQQVLTGTGIVGKSNSLADLVKTVYRDLLSGEQRDYRIPDTRKAVASCIFQYQNSHRPQDVWHFVTPDFRTSSIWVQLTSGDNRDMSAVARAVDQFIARTKAAHKDDPDHPVNRLRYEWFGLTYLNVTWQHKMVTGMVQAFAGSFLVVLLLMAVLFRSVLWGLLSMIPLTVTIGAIYGAVGLIGKDYDMPVAVLSSLTLGLAVDFAIHFLARGRSMFERYGSWQATAPAVFGEPARAITRNIIVIAAGFLPLILAPLVPYKTVGVLLATILLASGVGTLLLLPALVTLLRGRLFRPAKVMGPVCNCALCISSGVILVAVVLLSVVSFGGQLGTMVWIAAATVVLAVLVCGVLSRRRACRMNQDATSREEGK